MLHVKCKSSLLLFSQDDLTVIEDVSGKGDDHDISISEYEEVVAGTAQEAEVAAYMAGWLIHKLKLVDCPKCEELLTSTEKDPKKFLYLKQYKGAKLVNPSKAFLDYVAKLEQAFVLNFNMSACENVSANLKHVLMKKVGRCSCLETHAEHAMRVEQDVVSMYVKVRLFAETKKLNKAPTKKFEERKEQQIKKLKTLCHK